MECYNLIVKCLTSTHMCGTLSSQLVAMLTEVIEVEGYEVSLKKLGNWRWAMQLYRQTLLPIHSASWVQSDQPASCLSTTERRPSPLSLNLPTWLFTSDVIPGPWSIESADLCFKAVNVHLLLEWHVHRTIHAVSSCCGDLVMFLHIPILLYICKQL